MEIIDYSHAAPLPFPLRGPADFPNPTSFGNEITCVRSRCQETPSWSVTPAVKDSLETEVEQEALALARAVVALLKGGPR